MASLNKVFLIGNVTRDVEIRYTASGTALCTLGLAVNRRYTTNKGEERDETCFVDIDVWGKQAETCQQYLRKGAPAFVEGRLRFDQWDDRDTGKKRSRLMVNAERVQFLGSSSRSSGFSEAPEEYRSAGFDNSRAPTRADIPNESSGVATHNDSPPFPKGMQSTSTNNPGMAQSPVSDNEPLDDIPF